MIYFDHAATTRVLPEAAQAAMKTMTEDYGNPSSLYQLGVQAAKRMGEHREQVARALGCQGEEVYFTSGGTEGDNWAVALAVHLGRHKGRHIITTAIEHAAVLQPCKELERQGYEVTYLHPDASGRVRVEDLEAALRPDTVLVSMMLVNNETGALQPVAQAAQLLRRKQSAALLHTDAVQGFLKIPFTPKGLGVDLLTISGHKIGAMKGSGALYLRKGLRAVPLIRGGGQERGLRSGTEATPQIAALAAAASLGRERMEEHTAALTDLKAYALGRPSSGGCPAWRWSPQGTRPTSAPSPCRGIPARWWCAGSVTGASASPPALPAIGGRPAMSMPPCTCPKGCGTGCCGYPSAQRTPGRRWTSWPRPFWRPPGTWCLQGDKLRGNRSHRERFFYGAKEKVLQ